MNEGHKVITGISIGDVNGIGPEIILRVFSDSRLLDVCTPVVYGSFDVLSYYRKLLHLPELPLLRIKSLKELKKNKVNVIDCVSEKIEIELGHATPQAGMLAFESLKRAVSDAKSGEIDVLVTSPLNKKNIRAFHDGFTGHTGYLSEVDEQEALMVLCSEKMRIAMVTGHVPLESVAKNLTVESIIEKLEAFNKCLKVDFGIDKPRIAVLGLNPHAGEDGLLGNEEKQIVLPAIDQVKTKGIVAVGPYPSDGFFGSGNYQNFDGILAMYHDQALIPFKTLSFENGVNFSSGLSFVRTSPDHGTAYEIAGQGKASESSLRESIYYASDIFHKRKEELSLSESETA